MKETIAQRVANRPESTMPEARELCSSRESMWIEKAKNLLLNPHYSLSEIAEHLDFPSLTHFNRDFRQIVGKSPTAYRQTLEQAIADLPEASAMLMKIEPAVEKLKLLIVYSGHISGHEAMRACERVLKRIDKEHGFEFQLWRLDLLEQPDICAQASRGIAAADIIIVTVDDDFLRSESFQRWAQDWPPHQFGARRALVAFQCYGDVSSKSESQTVEFLTDLAKQKRMDLVSNLSAPNSLAHAVPLDWKNPPRARAVQIRNRAELNPILTATERQRHEFRGFGINE